MQLWVSQWVSKASGRFSYSLWWPNTRSQLILKRASILVITVSTRSGRTLLVLTVMTKRSFSVETDASDDFRHHSEYEKRPIAFDTHCDDQTLALSWYWSERAFWSSQWDWKAADRFWYSLWWPNRSLAFHSQVSIYERAHTYFMYSQTLQIMVSVIFNHL